EQVMLLSQKLAGFSKGQADMLRKAMGKKKKKLIDELHPLFIEGGTKNGHPEKVLNKVWKDWEAFASYAFNKSHSTCYAFVAFQTAYLKAHYPAEFMASVLTHNKNDITKVTFFLRECKRMGLQVLGPDINESESDFSVNQDGQIRFGLSALKGVGEGPVEEILEERKEGGPFQTVFDAMRRLPLKSVNKKVLESLVLGGALDTFEDLHRALYFAPSDKFDTFLEHLLKYGHAYHAQKAQAANSLFGASDEILIPEPKAPESETWSLLEKLNREKDVTGIYISGHPLDDYRMEVQHYTTCALDQLDNYKGRDVKIAGIVSSASHRISKKGTGWGIFTIADFSSSIEIPLFSEDYQKFKSLLSTGQCVFIRGVYQQRWNSEEFQLKIKEVSLLESTANKLTESITLKLYLEQITDEMINSLEDICKDHRGQHRLRMKLIDRNSRTTLTLASRNQKVHANNDFIQALDRLGLDYSLS
ncbi:MAG: DNA polymerase III subunit alpha, partial [Phaeodactylibacter sp.]|nr:DNA polymerase III subunit alpha [Phaeodactylibacter sp.]